MSQSMHQEQERLQWEQEQQAEMRGEGPIHRGGGVAGMAHPKRHSDADRSFVSHLQQQTAAARDKHDALKERRAAEKEARLQKIKDKRERAAVREHTEHGAHGDV